MNTNTAPTGWTDRNDGTWERMINGITYFIAWEEGLYYLYRSLGWERIDCAAHFDAAAQIALDYEWAAE